MISYLIYIIRIFVLLISIYLFSSSTFFIIKMGFIFFTKLNILKLYKIILKFLNTYTFLINYI